MMAMLFRQQPLVPSASSIVLREYQSRAIATVRELHERVRRVLMVSPTGSGKTCMFAAIIAEEVAAGNEVLVLAHRSELIDQSFSKIVAAGVPEHACGVIMGQDARRNPGAPVQIASVQTLRNRVGTPRMPPAKFIVVDEAHHASADSYRSILACYPNARILGATATPWRLDGRGLVDDFDESFTVATIRELIAEGHLVPLHCLSHPTRPQLENVHVRNGDFVESEVARVMMQRVLLGSMVEHYNAHAAGRIAFGFAVNVEHAQACAATFAAAGVRSAVVHGATPREERAATFSALRRGDISILWNCEIATEGVDVIEAKSIILGRPTLSRALMFQMIGRSMRPASFTGFTDCVVLDHAGLIGMHGHPLEPQDYSLGRTREKRPSGLAPMKTCDACGASVPAGCSACPECGAAFERQEVPDDVPGSLTEVRPRPPVIMSPAAEEDLCKKALRKAVEQQATNPIRYATTILERQLRRPPARDVFERAALAVLSKPKPAPVVSGPEMPSWLKKNLGIPVADPPAPPPPPPSPAPIIDEEIVEVSF